MQLESGDLRVTLQFYNHLNYAIALKLPVLKLSALARGIYELGHGYWPYWCVIQLRKGETATLFGLQYDPESF